MDFVTITHPDPAVADATVPASAVDTWRRAGWLTPAEYEALLAANPSPAPTVRFFAPEPTRVVFCTSVSNKAAPTRSEINAGLDLSNAVVCVAFTGTPVPASAVDTWRRAGWLTPAEYEALLAANPSL